MISPVGARDEYHLEITSGDIEGPDTRPSITAGDMLVVVTRDVSPHHGIAVGMWPVACHNGGGDAPRKGGQRRSDGIRASTRAVSTASASSRASAGPVAQASRDCANSPSSMP